MNEFTEGEKAGQRTDRQTHGRTERQTGLALNVGRHTNNDVKEALLRSRDREVGGKLWLDKFSGA